MTKKVLIYKGFERFWHWMQALLVIFLMFTGFEIHGSFEFFGFRDAVRYHNIAAYLLLGLIIFAIFWHLTTGEWRQYIPTKKLVKEQLNYYIFGIFKNLPHPTKKTTLSKLNPLQKIVYFFLKVVLFPTTVVSGLLYMFYRYPTKYGIEAINISSLEWIASFHSLAAYFFVAFLIAHLYLITTGQTLTSNLKAMLTGYEEFEDENNQGKELSSSENNK